MNGQLQDIRWKQRFSNYQKALAQLRKFFAKETLNELEQQGLIQAFEYTYELAWNVMKDYLTYEQADLTIMGSRDAIRRAFQRGLIDDGHDWMDMISSRINSAHTYNDATAQDIVAKITRTYFRLFTLFEKKMEELL
ncbi:MAG: nucleotidyltransferase substrate binding protein [Prevotellaceae bacterium]|jgi:nucleotidyltransferase substrate binding protein (TIGR01987 family)|nr:nucleotidyltransferase substrate binding protein [Prevotellaceae bacterium]